MCGMNSNKTPLESILELIFDNKESIKDINSLYSIFETDNDKNMIHVIISTLSHAVNCHIENFKDLKNTLLDLYEAYKQYLYKDVLDFADVCEILRLWDSEKYGYADEHDKFWKLKVITDSDFIPYKSMTEEEYHIIYDILYNDACGTCAYDVVATYYNEYKTPIGRKVALKHWSKWFQRIIDNLQNYIQNVKEGDVCVYIPFLDKYKETATHVMDLFIMAQDSAFFLGETDGETVTIENTKGVKRVPSMCDIFEKWALNLQFEESAEEANVIYDEMVRRGLSHNIKTINEVNLYRKKYIGTDESSLVKEEKSTTEDVKEKSVKDRTAVIYYMLKDKVEIPIIQKVAHFVCNPTKEYKGANPNDTIYTYIAHPDEKFLDKADRIDYITEMLTKYKFEEDYIKKNIK